MIGMYDFATDVQMRYQMQKQAEEKYLSAYKTAKMQRLYYSMKQCEARTGRLTGPQALFIRGYSSLDEIAIVVVSLDRGRLAAEVDAATVGEAHAPLLACVKAEEALQEL